jgi:hypothetical protein
MHLPNALKSFAGQWNLLPGAIQVSVSNLEQILYVRPLPVSS